MCTYLCVHIHACKCMHIYKRINFFGLAFKRQMTRLHTHLSGCRAFPNVLTFFQQLLHHKA